MPEADAAAAAAAALASGNTDPAAAAAAATAAAAAEAARVADAAKIADPNAWHAKLDAETRGYAENRGLLAKDAVEAFVDAARSHREAQAHIGTPADQLLKLPKADAPAEEWKAVWQKLGMPADATGYDFSAVKSSVEGRTVDPALIESIRAAALDANLPAPAAVKVAAAIQAHLDKAGAESATEAAAKLEAGRAALKANWGQNFDANLTIAKQAFAALVPSQEAMAALEGQVGYDAVMEMFRKIGSQIGEDKFVTNGMPARGLMTRDAAMQRIAELKTDTEWTTKFLNGSLAEKKEFDNLHAIAYGTEQAAA